MLCTLFPGPDGLLRMSIPFAPEVKRRIRAWAKTSGKSTEEFSSQAIKDALARDRPTETARQECALNFFASYLLLAEFTSERHGGHPCFKTAGINRRPCPKYLQFRNTYRLHRHHRAHRLADQRARTEGTRRHARDCGMRAAEGRLLILHAARRSGPGEADRRRDRGRRGTA